MAGSKYHRAPSETESPDEAKKPFLESNDNCLLVQFYEQKQRKVQRALIFQWVVIAVLCVVVVAIPLSMRRKGEYYIPNELYSPARDVVRYETKVFQSGFGSNKSPYMGYPTKENRQRWEDLYQAGISIIPMEQAAKLPVDTTPIAEVPGHYVVGLDVFHQLHCLNQLRLHLWGVPDPHGHAHKRDGHDKDDDDDDQEDGLQGMGHLDHCVDSIRQSLMCSSDISLVTWHWDEGSQLSRPHANITHTCRDFEAIREWALDRRAPAWDQSIHVLDPLKGEI